MSIELVVFDLEAVTDIAETAVEVFGMTPALRRLRARGVKVAVVTRLSRHAAQHVLRQLGWLGGEVLDACTTVSDVDRAAPYPDMVPNAMQVLGVRHAYRVAKVSGSPLGLLQGAAAGCSILVGVKNRGYEEDVLRGAPCTHVAPTAALVPELLARVRRGGSPVARVS